MELSSTSSGLARTCLPHSQCTLVPTTFVGARWLHTHLFQRGTDSLFKRGTSTQTQDQWPRTRSSEDRSSYVIPGRPGPRGAWASTARVWSPAAARQPPCTDSKQWHAVSSPHVSPADQRGWRAASRRQRGTRNSHQNSLFVSNC